MSDLKTLTAFRVDSAKVQTSFVSEFAKGNIVVQEQKVSKKGDQWLTMKVVEGDRVVAEGLRAASGTFTDIQKKNDHIDVLINPATGKRASEGDNAVINPALFFEAENGVIALVG